MRILLCSTCHQLALISPQLEHYLFPPFLDKELKELAMSFSACPRHVDAGPPSSSVARTMSIVRYSPNSVAASSVSVIPRPVLP